MASEKKFGEDYNMWAQYNDPNYIPQTVTQIRKTYRRTPYTPPLNTAPPPILPFLRPFPLPVIRPDYEPPNPEDQKLLSATPPSLPPPLANWKGVKVLGSGTSGAVVLFQHISHGTPQAPLNVLSDGTATMPFPTQIAVKTIEKPSFSVGIDREARLLKTLNESGSSHVVRLLGVPLVADLKREGLTAGWKGRSRRLILEYCSEGTLDGLIERRKARGVHYQRYGRELMFDAVFKAAREQFLPNPKFKDELVVHHDFKPENIFASGRDNTHEYTPVFKIGDFGLSQPWPTDPALQVPKHTEPDNQYYRQLGTPGYYAPEQFTPRWIFSDYKTSPVAGIYGSHTNVWGIGCCMYELLTLIIKTDDDICTPEPHIPFLPSTPLHGNAPRGLAFGTRLQGAREYSTELRDTVQECLYEGPRKRPRLVELKGRVVNMIRGLVERQGPGGEEWEDLSMPEPLTENEAAALATLSKTTKNAKALARVRTRSRMRTRTQSQTSAGPSQPRPHTQSKIQPRGRSRSASPARSTQPVMPEGGMCAIEKWRCTYFIERKGRVCDGRRRGPKEKGFRCFEHLDREKYPDRRYGTGL